MHGLKLVGASLVFLILGMASAWLVLTLLPTTISLPAQTLLQTFGIRKPIVLGFMPYWLLSKAQPNSLQKLTNITYFGLEIAEDGRVVRRNSPQELEPGWNALEKGRWAETLAGIQSKKIEKSLLLHLSNEASISALLSEPTLHAQTLVADVQPLMQQHGFTDLNLDIESFKTASPSARARMSEFLQAVKKQMVEQEVGTLTVELTVASLIKDHLLDPAVVGSVADRVVLMAYDFSYRDSYISGAVAPVGGTGESIEYDVVESVKLATQIIPAEKILLGIPLYGYEWETLTYQPNSAVIPGTGKTATHLRVEELKKNCTDCQQGRDEVTGSPYLMAPPNEDSAIQQIYYEDPTSVKQKVDLAKEYRLGGVALWAVGYESVELLEPLTEYERTVFTEQ